MSASLVSGYTGLLEDIHVVRIAKLLGVAIRDGAVEYGRYAIGGPTEQTSFVVQRTAMFDAIRGFQANAQVEAEVLAILSRYDAAAADSASPKSDVRMGVPARIEALRDELRHIYPILKAKAAMALPMR